MAYFHTTVLDNQIKALPIVDTASGSVATFDTDMTENLVEVKCQIVATQSGSGTPSPSNPRPITTYTSLNLSHSGADTSNPTVYNIPFGQTAANGVIDVTTGKLRVTHGVKDLGTLDWTKNADWGGAPMFATSSPINDAKGASSTALKANSICDIYETQTRTYIYNNTNVDAFNLTDVGFIQIRTTVSYATESDFKTAMSGHYMVYELKTPIDIQLDSTQIQALLNENNIWCDTGDTEVKFLLTVGKAIS